MKIHYAGGLKIYRNGGVTEMLRGWASCVSGDRAYSIREQGNFTYNKENVTCKSCLKNMKAAGVAGIEELERAG